MVLLESYGARLARQGLAGSTRTKYLAAVERFLRSLDVADPATVTRQQVDDYLDRWHAAEQPAANTVRLHLSALKSFYGYLDDRELLQGRNPVERIRAPRVRRRPNDRLRAEEAETLLAGCLTEREKILIWLLRWTGLRISEALALTVDDVDLDGRVIRVRASKTDAGLRAVPIVDELGVVLLTWLDGLRKRDDWRHDLPLLPTRGGTPWKYQYAWRLVKRVARRSELRVRGPEQLDTAVAPHTLRRTYASDLINRGVPLEHLSKTLGHSDIRITQQAYAELEDATAHAAIRKALAF
jgi:site-specific recombinase XerD